MSVSFCGLLPFLFACASDTDTAEACDVSLRYVDEDGDGYGNESVCARGADGDLSNRDGDCDDLDPGVFPGAMEGCLLDADGIDNDCDGVTDPACGEGWVTYAFWIAEDAESDCDAGATLSLVAVAADCPDCTWQWEVTASDDTSTPDCSITTVLGAWSLSADGWLDTPAFATSYTDVSTDHGWFGFSYGYDRSGVGFSWEAVAAVDLAVEE